MHPRKKKPVGERLALQALQKHYGHPLRADGPRLQDIRLEEGFLLLSFDQLLSCSVPLQGFEVLDGITALYRSVPAAIDGCSVRLDVRELTQPLAVRYGWEPYSLANLTDVRGLPASTFKQEL